MTSFAITRPLAGRRAPRAVAASTWLGIVAAALCATGVAVVYSTAGDDNVDRAVLQGLIAGVPVAVGLYATRSARTARFGSMLIAAGMLWSLTALAQTSDNLPYSVGRVSAWLIVPVLMYLMLMFPYGRLGPGGDRVLFAAVTALIAVLYVGSAVFVEDYPQRTPWTTCTTDCPANAFLVLDSEPAVMQDVVQPARELLGLVLLAGIAASLMRRRASATRLQRRTVDPVIFASVVSLATLSAFLIARRLAPDAAAVDSLGTFWALCIPGIAVAFGVGLMRRRLAIGEALQALSGALGRDLDAAGLRTGVAVALRDPRADLLYPDEVPGRWRTSAGAVASSSGIAAQGRAITPVRDHGAPIAALVHEPGLDDDDELLDAVAALVGTALRHQRLTNQLATSLGELDDSRKRIARAADVERSKIERDLHDGAQQRLISLRIKLAIAEDVWSSDPAAAIAAVRDLGSEVELALEELRSVAHGVYPSLLSDRGVADALRSVLAQAPLRGQLLARNVTRQSKEVETTVYFVCLEAIQNAIKHASGATGIWVTLRQDHAFRFEVRDDGPGFVPPGPRCNGGLRNMRDRVETLGGRLTIDSAPGHGTRIRGVVPLDEHG